MNVLIVENSRCVRETLTLLVEEAGYTVTAAADGEEALRLVARRRPDAVLIDLKQPKMSGWELRRRLRDVAPGVCVIFMSAGYHPPAELSAAQPAAYLAKPFEVDDLYAELDCCTQAQAA
jgi:DNA-binding response OmpR family regulator